MRTTRTAKGVGRLLAPVLLFVVGTGCGSEGAGGDGGVSEAAELADRARQVARAWDGSDAADAWRAGFHPLENVVQPPRGGLRTESDQRAFDDGRFVLRRGVELPAASSGEGRVKWTGSGQRGSLTRPLIPSREAYKSLARAGDGGGGRPHHLTVTGVRLGEMTLTTNRGPAVVPAWLFALDGYDAPLKQAAALPSKLPEPPVKNASGEVPGLPVRHLVRTATHGRAVTVIALHGACDDGALVKAGESGGSVVLSGYFKNPEREGLCTKAAKLQRVTVRLDRPLGERVLLDAHTGRPIPVAGPV